MGVIERDETGLVRRVTMMFAPLDAALSLSAGLGGIVGEEFADDLFYNASMNEIAYDRTQKSRGYSQASPGPCTPSVAKERQQVGVQAVLVDMQQPMGAAFVDDELGMW